MSTGGTPPVCGRCQWRHPHWHRACARLLRLSPRPLRNLLVAHPPPPPLLRLPPPDPQPRVAARRWWQLRHHRPLDRLRYKACPALGLQAASRLLRMSA